MNINSVVKGTTTFVTKATGTTFVVKVTDTTFVVKAADTAFVIVAAISITSVAEVVNKNFTEGTVAIKRITTARDRFVDCLVIKVAF